MGKLPGAPFEGLETVFRDFQPKRRMNSAWKAADEQKFTGINR
jgi:hypothetical protein